MPRPAAVHSDWQTVDTKAGIFQLLGEEILNKEPALI